MFIADIFILSCLVKELGKRSTYWSIIGLVRGGYSDTLVY